MSTPEQDKIIEKIKSLLELSGRDNTPENEKILAMQFAQKLMTKYCIRENEILKQEGKNLK